MKTFGVLIIFFCFGMPFLSHAKPPPMMEHYIKYSHLYQPYELKDCYENKISQTHRDKIREKVLTEFRKYREDLIRIDIQDRQCAFDESEQPLGSAILVYATVSNLDEAYTKYGGGKNIYKLLSSEQYGVFLYDAYLKEFTLPLKIFPSSRWRDYIAEIDFDDINNLSIVAKGSTYGDSRVKYLHKGEIINQIFNTKTNRKHLLKDSSFIYTNQKILDYFYVEGVNVNKVLAWQNKELDAIYDYVVAYAVNMETSWKDDTVGVFLVSKKGAKIIDIFHTQNDAPQIPRIIEFSSNNLTIGLYNEVLDIKKFEYEVNIGEDIKVVSRKVVNYEKEPDEESLNKAINLAKNEEYEKALTILSSCLSSNSVNNPLLEECLYQGEVIVEKALHVLYKRYETYTELQHTFGDIKNWLATMGIIVRRDTSSSAIKYTNNYLKQLIKLFPDSKYQDVYAFKQIKRGTNSKEAVFKWIKELELYRSKYPDGRHMFNATVNLANAYDNLWEILSLFPEYEGYSEYYSTFTSGNKKIDKKSAEKYRNKALELYKFVISNGKQKNKIEERLLQISKDRFESLSNREPLHHFSIISD